MRREFIDEELITWEVHSSTGRFGLPEDGRLVFLCTTDPLRRPRVAPFAGDVADAEAALTRVNDGELRALLRGSRELR